MCAAVLTSSQSSFAAASKHVPDNPKTDAKGHLTVAQKALTHRAKRRLTEAEFLRMSAEPDTIILDARSAKNFALLHIAGAVNLNFSDITEASLARVIPRLDSCVLIYRNNNFLNAENGLPTKRISAPLNLSTYAALYDYGYYNVYELSPYLDATKTKLTLVVDK